MPSPANIRESKIAFGFKPESGINVANITSDCWSMNVLNDQLAAVELATESDANWIGKGDEFATQTFNSHWNVSRSIEKYCSSQFLAHLAVFALGVRTKSVVETGFQYICTPIDPSTGGINLPTFTFVEAIRQGGSAVMDRALLSCAWEEFAISLASGPGLANSKVTAQMIGTGKKTEPSAITIPTQITDGLLPGATMTISVNGVDYVSNKNIISADFGWKNNIRSDSAFFPGSGFQTTGNNLSGQVRGRQEFGDRVPSFRFVARFLNGSTELTALQAQSTGVVTITLTGALIPGSTTTFHKLTWVLQKHAFKSAVVANSGGIVSVAVEGQPIKHLTNGLLTMTVVTDVDLIGG